MSLIPRCTVCSSFGVKPSLSFLSTERLSPFLSLSDLMGVGMSESLLGSRDKQMPTTGSKSSAACQQTQSRASQQARSMRTGISELVWQRLVFRLCDGSHCVSGELLSCPCDAGKSLSSTVVLELQLIIRVEWSFLNR